MNSNTGTSLLSRNNNNNGISQNYDEISSVEENNQIRLEQQENSNRDEMLSSAEIEQTEEEQPSSFNFESFNKEILKFMKTIRATKKELSWRHQIKQEIQHIIQKELGKSCKIDFDPMLYPEQMILPWSPLMLTIEITTNEIVDDLDVFETIIFFLEQAGDLVLKDSIFLLTIPVENTTMSIDGGVGYSSVSSVYDIHSKKSDRIRLDDVKLRSFNEKKTKQQNLALVFQEKLTGLHVNMVILDHRRRESISQLQRNRLNFSVGRKCGADRGASFLGNISSKIHEIMIFLYQHPELKDLYVLAKHYIWQSGTLTDDQIFCEEHINAAIFALLQSVPDLNELKRVSVGEAFFKLLEYSIKNEDGSNKSIESWDDVDSTRSTSDLSNPQIVSVTPSISSSMVASPTHNAKPVVNNISKINIIDDDENENDNAKDDPWVCAWGTEVLPSKEFNQSVEIQEKNSVGAQKTLGNSCSDMEISDDENESIEDLTITKSVPSNAGGVLPSFTANVTNGALNPNFTGQQQNGDSKSMCDVIEVESGESGSSRGESKIKVNVKELWKQKLRNDYESLIRKLQQSTQEPVSQNSDDNNVMNVYEIDLVEISVQESDVVMEKTDNANQDVIEMEKEQKYIPPFEFDYPESWKVWRKQLSVMYSCISFCQSN